MRKFRHILMAGVLALGSASAVSAETVIESGVPEYSYGARLTGYEYPFEVRTFAFRSQLQPLEMAYMYLQPEKDMPVVVLMHGKNFNGAYWKSTADYLQDQGYGVLIPDQIGFGKSSKPESYQYSFSQLALNTSRLINELRIEDAILLGHSMGGMVASRFALTYPARVEKLILLNPIGLEDYLDYSSYPEISDAYERELQQTDEGIIAYQQRNYYDGDWNETYEALTVPLRGWIHGPDAELMAYISALTYDMILTQPVIDDFPEISVPATFILGTRDRTGPNRANMRDGVTYELGRYDQFGAKMLSLVPDSKVIELEGLGHSPHIEAFDRFVPALAKALTD